MNTTAPTARFPFSGYPKGWFVVALSEDVPAREVVRLRYFGKDLVAYRGGSGRVFVSGAYCPHLGAHLGHGGVVEGDSLRCPFHGWRFGEDGRCDDIPYCETIPTKARLETFPVREQNGVIHVFYDPAGGAPWPLDALDDTGWTPGKLIHWKALRTHPQEVFENTVDMAHIGPIHAGRDAGLKAKPTRDGERMQVDLSFQAPGDIVGMPELLNDVHLSVSLRGLGDVVVHTHVKNVDVRARQRIYVTPIDEDTVDIRGIVHVAQGEDRAQTDELADIFYRAYVEDFAKDFPIWEHKAYLERPQLAKGDGPIPLYRRWCTQFYPAPASTNEVATPAPDVGIAALRRRGARLLAPIEASVQGVRRRVVEALMPRASNAPPVSAARSAAPASPSVSPKPAAPTVTLAAPTGPRLESVEDYVDTLADRFVPSAATGVDAVFEWSLDDEAFHAIVRDAQLDVMRGRHPKPSVRLVASVDDYLAILNGELDGVSAFASGRCKVEGSLGLAMRMRTLFPM